MTPTEPDRIAEYVAPKLTVGSLFSGIGGIDLGLERAGWRVLWQSEVNPYAAKVLAKHWPDVPNLGDVSEIDWSDVERPQLVCGGFPCQPVSLAGRGLAQLDPRWLWPAFARCVRLLRPRHVLVENVPGLLVRGMGDVLGDLAALGYDTEWTDIPAAAVGAPHLRWRIFVVAHADDAGLGQRRGTVAVRAQHGAPQRQGEDGLGHPYGERLQVLRDLDPRSEPGPGGWWSVEPDVGRVVDGVPSRVDRLRCLGNAVVPQVAEFVGRRLAAHIDGYPCAPTDGSHK